MKTIWISEISIPNLVSVIIPSYNRAHLIGKTIESVFSQTYRPIECILVDDGSTDNTSEIVKEFINKSPDSIKVIYIYQENAGAQAARNAGTIASKGEFIQYLDSDDILYPDKIKQQIDFLRLNPNCDGVYGDWEKGNSKYKEFIKAIQSEDLISQFLGKRCIANFSFLMRRIAINKTGPWDVNIKRNQEVDYHLSGLMVKCNFIYLSFLTGLWGEHDGDRIFTNSGLKSSFYFFQKWYIILKKMNLLNSNRTIQIGNSVYWIAANCKNEPLLTIYKSMRFANNMNPYIKEFNTPKMLRLKLILGTNLSIFVWVILFRFKKLC